MTVFNPLNQVVYNGQIFHFKEVESQTAKWGSGEMMAQLSIKYLFCKYGVLRSDSQDLCAKLGVVTHVVLIISTKGAGQKLALRPASLNHQQVLGSVRDFV